MISGIEYNLLLDDYNNTQARNKVLQGENDYLRESLVYCERECDRLRRELQEAKLKNTEFPTKG